MSDADHHSRTPAPQNRVPWPTIIRSVGLISSVFFLLFGVGAYYDTMVSKPVLGHYASSITSPSSHRGTPVQQQDMYATGTSSRPQISELAWLGAYRYVLRLELSDVVLLD